MRNKIKLTAVLSTILMVLYFGIFMSTDYFSKPLAFVLFGVTFALIVISNIVSFRSTRGKTTDSDKLSR